MIITQSYRQSSHIWNKEKRLNPAECAEALCRIFAVKENVRSLQEKGFAIAWLNCYTGDMELTEVCGQMGDRTGAPASGNLCR